MLAQLAASLLLAAPNPHLRAAKIFYDEFQFSRCVQQLAQAGAAPASEAELVDIEIYGGLCRYSLGDFKGADEHFRVALKLDPRATLPPMTSPKLSERFEAERARLAPPPTRPDPEPPAPAAAVPADAPVQAELTPAPAAPSGELAAAPAQPSRVGPAPFVLAGAAVVAAAAGAVLGARARAVAADASAEPLDLRSDRLAASARGLATGANVSYGLGAALAAAAVVTFVVQLP